jgi:circadian clock protein KaiB
MPGKKTLSEKAIQYQELDKYQLLLKDPPEDKYILKLYITGMTLRSKLAIENIHRICADYLPGRCDLEVIDILRKPAQAREAQIIAAPTLIKKSPLPMHRLIGDMSKTEKVLSALDLVFKG